MARFYGKVGYGTPTDIGDGVWEDVITEREYFGDITQNYRKTANEDSQVNPDISVSNTISIVADQYAMNHFHNIRYVEWDGVRWTTTSIEVNAPRLKLWLGKVYNGPTP